MRFLYKITRPVQVLAAFFGTWVSAQLSQAPEHLAFNAALAMAMGGLGSSLFHYGAAHKMYARKTEVVEIKNPFVLIASGLAAFTAALLITDWLLPKGAATIMWFNVVVVSMYGHSLSKWWFTKNLTIAAVCTTPLALGWWVGTTTHPAMPYLAVTVFCAYYAREIVKDIADINANEGLRVTLPIRFGPKDAQRVAGVFAVLSTASTLYLTPYGWPVAVASAVLLAASLALFLNRNAERTHSTITVGMFVLIVAFGL